MTEECRHSGGEIRFRVCTLWNIMITYQEDPLTTTWKLYCDSQTVPGACRINLMKGLIRPFHYTCHTCQTEATGHGALPARSGCILFDRCSNNMGAWTSSRTFTHDPPTTYCQGIGTEWLPRRSMTFPEPFRSFKTFRRSESIRVESAPWSTTCMSASGFSMSHTQHELIAGLGR